MGDKADLSGNDFLEYWEQDPETTVVALYLSRSATRAASGGWCRGSPRTSRWSRGEKSGHTAAGERAASSRTGALLAAADVTVDALFAHAGVLRAETVGEMFDVAGLLARQPLPRGEGVAVAHQRRRPRGPSARRACEAADLRIEPPSTATRARLAEGLAPEASTGNPVNMIASATAERGLRRGSAADHLLTDDLPIGRHRRRSRPPLAARAAEVGRAIAAAPEGADRPVLAVWLGADTPGAEDTGAVPALQHARVRGAGAGAGGPACAPPRRAAGPSVRGRRRRHRRPRRRSSPRAWAGCRRRCPATAALLGHLAGAEPARRLRAGRGRRPPRNSGAPSR